MRCRYQCTYETFAAAGYSRAEGERLTRKAVHLASEARKRFVEESDGAVKIGDVKIALSMGPYGVTCSPGQEYGGFYPPPFGPQAYSASGPNTNAFAAADQTKRSMSIDALTDFHLQRLRIHSNDLDSWKEIDLVAFETIPLAREIKAIRGAMRLLQIELEPRPAGFEWKPWWISTVWPDGRFPHESGPGKRRLSVKEVVFTLLHEEPKMASQSIDHYEVQPDGIGINCTSMAHLQDVLTGMEEVVGDLWRKKQGPWLVLYPNGGEEYDPVSRTWSGKKEGTEGGTGWAENLAALASAAMSKRLWGGVVVGGCCKTGPDEIRSLAACLSS